MRTRRIISSQVLVRESFAVLVHARHAKWGARGAKPLEIPLEWRASNASAQLRVDADWHAQIGEVPGEPGFVQRHAEAAVRAGVAPVAAPVVVMNAGAV